MAREDERKVLLVIGITGNQGGSVARTFLNDPDLCSTYKVRGLSRNVEGEAARKLAEQGAEMVTGDLNDAESLRAAFRGVHVVFGMTDYFHPFMDSANSERAKKEGVSIRRLAYDIELQHGKNIVDAAASQLPSRGGKLERFVLSVLSSPKKWSKGRYSDLYHHESKVDTWDYARSKYPDLGALMSTILVGIYYYSWQIVPAMGPRKQADGTHVIRLPCKGDTPIPMIHPNLDTGVFVRALLEMPPGVQAYGATRLMSWKEYLELFGRIKGKPVRYEECSVQEFADILDDEGRKHRGEGAAPEGFGLQMSEMFEYMGEFGYDGGDPECKRKEQLAIRTEDLSSLEDYIRTADWTSVGA